MATPPQAASLFETPVIVDTMPDFQALNRMLAERILARRAESPGVTISNLGGWQSDVAMLEWGGEAAHRLVERIIGAADYFTLDVKSPDKARYKWFPEMWANVSKTGGLNNHHYHPGAVWSAVYYVDDGYGGSADDALGGELVFHDPRMPTPLMNTPDLRFRRPGQRPYEHERWMRPAAGRIVIFPGWLAHSVRPYNGSGTRISIAVNLSAVPLSVAS